ncbi:PhzF family phenazine biosynthesis protein [Natronomonas sp. EA1]|uniref:PhzF family phenazine biosynthesis protein n=1 Tax=Natronomonas sp. EA1 TaxID=3421655 RepID=UPI003EC10DE3
MHTRRALLVDAFTDDPLAGNVAGVVPEADGLSDSQMQAIARELRAPETAFLLSSTEADRTVRFFSPTGEVDLCGHATIASHALLAAEGLDEGTHTLETNVGVLDIELDGETVWMTQTYPDVRKLEVAYGDVAEALGIGTRAFTGMKRDLPLARASTGLPFLVVPVEYLSDLSDMAPDFREIERLTDEHDCAGLYTFTFDTLGGDATLHGRMFAPGLGIDEDPVTGTASGAVGAYLDVFDAFDSTPEEMVFEQGHFVDRPGRVRVRATGGPEARPQVGGRAVVSFEGDIAIPADEDDDIIEA